MSWCQWQDPQENKSPDGGSPQELQTPQENILGVCVFLTLLQSLFLLGLYTVRRHLNPSLSVHKSYVMVQEPQENKTPDGGSRQEPQKPEENILGDCAFLTPRPWLEILYEFSEKDGFFRSVLLLRPWLP